MRPVRNVFQKLSRTEQRREGLAAYLCLRRSQVLRPPPPPPPPRVTSSPVGYRTEDTYVQYMQGVTKRCRLSWLTNGALAYEPKPQ